MYIYAEFNPANIVRIQFVPYYFIMEHGIFNVTMAGNRASNETKRISSEPYLLCFCESNENYNCSEMQNAEAYRGQKFTVSLLALAQGNTIISTPVSAKIDPRARLSLEPNVSSQLLLNRCTDISYRLYSPDQYEEVTVYLDAPCRDTGLATAIINMTLLPCPDAFIQSGEQCVCEERLQEYGAECTIDEEAFILRRADTKLFWISALYDNNGTYQGLILYKTCPLDYCNLDTVSITLSDLDVQCDNNRSGLLCGACATNHSFMFGGSQCQVCSDAYLALLVAFAVAGIALVAFLTFLRLTVATGMINSIILYANIVQVNKSVFFSSSSRNVLTVFLTWMNLDLGFRTCFYNGMDAYVQTWLQFVFPVYIWILISLIILSSRYSITVSKLIGSNPIAVLATLLLMSYTKILKIIIEVYSSVELDYPDNKTVTVWLKDANVPYLHSKHLFLAVVTSLVFIFFFLPYTLLLLLGYKLYRFSGRKHFRWFNRIKLLLDAYYAPYKTRSRYWTGFLLLVRCALYIVFSFNSLGATNKSLLAIVVTFSILITVSWFSVVVYKLAYVNILEVFIYLNIIILTAATATGANSPILVHALVGLVFVSMMIISAYHFHLLYVARSALLHKVKSNLTGFVHAVKTRSLRGAPLLTDYTESPERTITTTIVDINELKLEAAPAPEDIRELALEPAVALEIISKPQFEVAPTPADELEPAIAAQDIHQLEIEGTPAFGVGGDQ